ncbi:MAG: hypothetical protein ACRDDZ_00945 [Marinifilaceae bacterium]
MRKQMLTVGVLAAMFTTGCAGTQESKTETKTATEMTTKTGYVKKYTNADYYKDGKLQADVVLKAYEEMLAHYGITLSPFMRENLWITDFELGDFENCGMAGFFWVNDDNSKYFAHEIYLLPGQMITEHKHVPTEKFAAKMESWVVKEGWAYNFSVGEETPNCPKLPACQEGFITAKNYVVQKPNEIVHLKEIETPHFLLAGDNGAVIMEFASYHDGDGLRFTNPNVEFTDVLSAQ